MYNQMETLPNTTGQKKTGSADRPLEEGRITIPACDFEDVQVLQDTQIHSLVSSDTSVNTIHDQFTLNFMSEDKQERESTVSSHECREGEASLINEPEQECSYSPEEGLNSSTDGTEGAQTGTVNEGISDHCLELKNETLKLTEDLACVQEIKMSEYREGEEEHREVHMVGDRKECEDVVEARFTMQTVEPDEIMTLSPKKKKGASSDQYLSYDTELRCDSSDNEIKHHRDEQYDLSDARLLTGESSMGENTGQTEQGVKEQNNEEEEKKDREMRTEEEEAENDEGKLLDLVRERKVIPFETLHEAESDAMDISNQAYSLQHDDAGEFLSDMRSKEGACIDIQADSNQLPQIEICHDTKLYEEQPFQSNDSMTDKERGNDITENSNQFFEEIKPSENICDTSALSIGKDGDNNSYAVVSNETVELTKRKDVSAEDRMLLVYDSLDAEDKVSTEKVLTTDHLMKRAEDDELSFPQQLQRKGACVEEHFDIDTGYRDLEKEEKTLQGLTAVAKEDDVIKNNVEQTGQANVSHTYSGAHEDDITSHLSEEQSKAVDCVEVIAATVTNCALDLTDDLHTEAECVVTGDSSFSQAGENPVHPVSNKCSHITELDSSHNTFDEKKENGMEGVTEEDVETETTNILQNDETLTTSFVYEENKEIKEGNGAKPECGVLDKENEALEMNKKQSGGMDVAPTIILDVSEQIDSAVLKVQNNSGEVVDAMVQKNQSQENMETEPHGQSQTEKKKKFGSTRRPRGGHRPDTDIEERIWKDVEATEEIKHDDQNTYSEETSQQAGSQSSVSEVSLGIIDLHSETETVEMIDTAPVVMSNAIVCQIDTVILEENSKAEDPGEIIEHEKSTVEDERTDDSTYSDEQKMSSIITEIPNDTSTYYNRSQEAFMVVQDPDMERTDNGSPSQVNTSPTSVTMEFTSQTQGSLDMLENTENTLDFASDRMRQLSWNLDIFADHLNQPTNRESELESTCSFILIQESKTTEDDVITDHAELSISGTKMGLIQRTEQHHEGDQKENIEETSEKEGKRGEKDYVDRHGEKKDVPLTDSSNISSRKNEVIEEENKETTEEMNSAPTEESATEDFTAVCSEQYMNPVLSSQITKWVLTTNRQTPQGAELSDSKDDDGNSKENAEMRSTEPQAQNQSKKKRKFGSTRRPQGGQRPDTEGKERKWKDVEATEGFEHDKEERCSKETTHQAAAVNSLTKPQIAVSEVSLGILDLTMEKEITESKDETGLTDIVVHYIDNELSKVEELVEITGEHPQSVEDDEKANKLTSSDKQEMSPVIMKTENDTSTYHDFSQEASMVVKECDVESSENRSPSHVHASPISGTMELISEIQDILDIPRNIVNTDEIASDQMRQLPWDHNISEEHLDLHTNRDSELEQNESTCSLIHIQESKKVQDDVITENSELNTSGKRGKMEPTQKSHRKQFHGHELDDSVEEINEKEGKHGKKDDEDTYGEEKDVHLTDRSNIPSLKNESESEKTEEVINAGPAKDSTTEDFIAVCSKQYKDSGLSSQINELGLTTNIQPSPVVEYSDFKDDGGNSKDDVEMRNAELHTQHQSKKKRKSRSTRRPQGGHRPDNDGEQRKRKDVEATEEFEHNEEERFSKETTNQAATLNSLTEPQIAVSEVSLGVLDPPLEKEMIESKDKTVLTDIVVHHIDNEVSKREKLVEIRHPVVEYESDDESTSTDKQKMPTVITEIQNDTSTYQTSSQEASVVAEEGDVESTENGNPCQVLSSPTCGTVELISKIQQSLDISVNTENTHELASYGIKQLAWDHSIPEDHLELQNKESEAEQFGNSSTLIHTQESKTTQDDVITENSEPSTSGKPRKIGSTRRSHRGRLHERDQKNPTEEISEKEEKIGYEDDEEKYGEEKDVDLTEISTLSSRKTEVLEEESKETMEEINASPAKDSSTEDFVAVCSEQCSSQTTELALTTNIQPSSVTEHSDSREDDGNSEENIEVKNAELQTQSQSKKKKKFGSTRRPQGGHRPDNKGEERKWKNVEATERTEHDEEERCSEETTNQAASSDLLAEPQNGVSEESPVIFDPPLKKEITESNDETGKHDIIDTPHVILTDTLVHHSDNEVHKAEKLVEIIEEHGQSIVEYERDNEPTSAETTPPAVTESQNDASTYHDSTQEESIIVKGHDMESTENRHPGQVHVTPTCGTVELNSDVQDSVGIPANTENIHEFVSDQIGQGPSDESISKDQVDQPTNEDAELEKVESTCSLVHIQEPKTTQENVKRENLELSTSGKRRKMGSTRRSHREPLHGDGLKESIEEINEKERESSEKDDDDDMHGEKKDVHLTETSNISIRKNEVVEEEREEIKEELKARHTEDSTTDDFIAVCSEQYMDSGLFSKTAELGLATNIQPSPVTEHSDSKDDGGNSEENVEIKNTELHTQNQSKKKRKSGSTQRLQRGHRPDNEGEERRWKDVESTEEIEDDEEERCSKETTNQAATSELLTESESAVNEVLLGIPEPPLEKEMTESNDETGEQGITDRPHVILTDTLVHHSDNEVSKAEELVEIIEEHEKSVVEYERGDESTSSETTPPVVTEIQNDASTYHDFSQEASIIVEGHDMESTENRSPDQVHVTPTCGTVELISQAQDSVGIPVNTENTHEIVSDQSRQLPSDESIFKDQLDQPTYEDSELEKVESTCSLVHIQEPKTTQENVMTENLEISTSGKRRKMGSTRRSHREPLHGGGLKESTEEINEKERESGEKDDEDTYGEEKDVHLTETSNISSRKKDTVEEEIKEIKDELNASPTEDSTTEDFIAVCSKQYMDSGLSSQTTELGLTTNIQPSPVTEHSDSKDDGGNSEENIKVKNAELQTHSQSKKKRKFGSTRRPQGGHRPDNEGEERKRKNVEATEQTEHDEEDRCSEETTNQAASSDLLTEPQNAVSEESLGILDPPLEKEITETKDETGGCGMIDISHVILTDIVVQHSDNEVHKAEEPVEIIEEHRQSVAEYEGNDESTFSETTPPVVTEIQNDASANYDISQVVEECDMESTENRSPSHFHVTTTCGTVELNSEAQDSVGIPVNTENAHELVSEQIGQLPSDESISKDQQDQPTYEDSKIERDESTCSLVHIQEPKTTQENVMTENLEFSTSAKRRKMGSTRRSHREPLHGGGLKESTEEINEKERERGEKDDEDTYGEEKDVHLTETSNISSRKNDAVEEEREEIKEELKASPTEDSTTEDFIAVCPEQYIDSALSSQTTELGLTTNIQPLPMTEHSDSKDDGGNSEENVEIKNTELHTQNQSKKKRKFGSTRRPQEGHRPDNEGEERRWKEVESTEEIEDDEEERCSKETTHQAATSELLTESESAVNEVLLGIPELPLEKEMIESNDETGEQGITDRPHVILTDTLVHHSDNEVSKAEELVEIIEEHEQSVVEYERGDESTSSETTPPVVTEIQNDASTYHDFSQEASIIVEGHDMESTENRSPDQVHVTPTCETVELNSEIHDSLGIPVNTENTHEFVSDQSRQLPSDESISKDQQDQPTYEDSKIEKVESTCSLVHIQEPKTSQENVMTENLEFSTSGKRRKMGSTRRSHREPLHGGGLKESIEEINEKERERGEKDDEDTYGEKKDVHLTETSNISIRKNDAVEEESEEIKKELKASHTEDSTTEDFTAVCSEQYIDSGLSSQTTELGLTTNIQPSPVTEHSDSKDDGGNSEENVEIKNTELHTQNQSKKKRKSGSTRKLQGGHRPDNEGEERKWKDVESTEEIKDDEEERCSKETTHQATSSELLTEPHSAESEVSLGIPEPPLEKEMIESNDETGEQGIIDTPHVILTDTLVHQSDNEVSKAEELMEIIEEHEQSVVEDKRGNESTSSETTPPVVTEIQNDASTYHDFSQEASIIVEGHDMESTENRSPDQVHVTPTCGTVELISEAQDSLGIPVNTENTHELVSDRSRQLPSDESISKDQQDQPTNEDSELEKVESTCSHVHIQEPKTTQENVMTENLELSTSGKRRKMGSTRRSHREPLHGGGLKESTEEINEKERESSEKDDEDTYGEEKDVHLTETSNISSRKNEAVEEDREEIKEELKARHTEDSTTEDFIAVCPEQYIDSALSSQTTELGLTTNIQPSPVTEHSDSKDDGGNSEENVEIKNTELHTQNQSKKKRKSGSTRRPQGGHRTDNEGEERRWKDVESTEEIEDDEEERCSKETTHQATTSELLTEPHSAESEVSIGIPEPPLEKEMTESNDETEEHDIIDTPHVILTDTLVHHSDNEVSKAEELVEIIEEHEQSVVEYERGDESTSSETTPPVVTEIQNDASTYHDFSQEASIIVEGHNMESTENRSPDQVHVTPTCGTVELNSEIHDSLGIPVNTENTHEFVSDQSRQLPSDESISKDQQDQPTNEDSELEKVESTCSHVHIQEPKTTQENVMTENLEFSTSGKRRKMGSTRRSHREPLHGGGLKESTEEINEKERERGEKDDEDMYGEKQDVHFTETCNISIRKNEVVEEEIEEIKEELKASPTEDSTTEDFTAVCSEQYMDSGLFSKTAELGLATNIQPSPVTEHSDSKDDGGNSEENVEIKNTELHTQNQSKKKRKSGSTRRPQGGHRPDNEGEERRWKDVESTEEIEDDEEERCSKETTHQATTSELLTEPHSAESEVSIGIPEPPLEKEMTESNDETEEHDIIDTPHVILTDTLVHHSDNEVSKAEELMEIIEEHEQSVVEYERGDESKSSETTPPVVTEIQNDVSTYHDFSQEASIIVEGHNMESTENRSPDQVHVTPTCGTVELNSEAQDSVGIPVNTENTHELVSDQSRQLPSDESIFKDQTDQPTNEDSEIEKVESTCSVVHIQEPKTTQENVMTENLELSTSGKRRKMGSTRRSHREPLHGGGLKESTEEINEKERESSEKDDEDMYGEKKDVHLTETSNISSRKNEAVEEDREEIKEELKASPTEDSTTEDFTAVCSEQYMDSGLLSQTNELGLTTNIQPSPVTEYSDSKEDDGNSEENIEVKIAELQTQNQSKKKKKFGSTRRPQGGHRPDNEGEERKRKDVEATEQTEHDKEERCSKEATSQAASSDLLAEPQSVVSEQSLSILDPPLEKEINESKDETGGCGMIDTSHVILTDIVVQHSDNEVSKAEKLVEITEEHEQSVVQDRRGDEFMFSDKPTMPLVVTEIQNDASTYHDFSKVVEECDIESTENRSPSQVHVTPTCGTVELNSEIQDSVGIPVNTENAHEFVSDQVGQLPSEESISKDPLDQPTNEDPELEKVESTCSHVHIQESKTTQENVMTENLELSTSGKRRKMGSTRRSHREPLHGGGLKESIEEINEKERESSEKDDEDTYSEGKDVHLTETSNISSRKNEAVEEEREEIKDELKAGHTEDSITEDFIAVCSEQEMHSGLSSQTTELGSITDIQPSPVTEHSDLKDDGGNSEENVEIKNTELHTQRESKKKRKFGSTRRPQGGHRPDNEGEERKWKDVESTEEIKDDEEERCSKETTHQATTSELLTEPHSAASEESLGIPEPPLEKEMIESNDETGEQGIIDRPHVILTDTLVHHSDNEVSKAEELMEIIEEHGQSVVEYERGDESTSSETTPPVVTEIQNDVSTYHDFSQVVEKCDMESTENRRPSQVHVTATCETVKLISEAQDSVGIPVNIENTHELVSEQIGQGPSDESISKDQQDQPTNEDAELGKVESTSLLIHIQEPKTTQENVMTENLELSTSAKRRKMGSTRRSHREPLHGGGLKEINQKERERGEKDDEDTYSEGNDVHLTETSNISSRTMDVVQEEREEIKDELKASPTEDSTTEDFIAVCSEQYMDSGLSSQTTELGLTTNIQPSPVTEHSDSKDDGGNSEENVVIKNTELHTQNQSKKKRKFGSTRRPQGGHRPDNEGEERRWKDVESTEEIEVDEEERCSKETTHQATTSELLTEPHSAASEVLLGIPELPLEKEMIESNDETGEQGITDRPHVTLTDTLVHFIDNDVCTAEEIVEITKEHGQSAVEYERDDESTSSNKQKIPPVVTEIQNDASTYLVEGHDMESTENRSPDQVHVTPTCGTVELNSEAQDILGIPVNTENTHELVSEQIGQGPSDESISKDQQDQPTYEDSELEKVESICSLVHIQEPKTTQENVITENLELSTSGKRRKMGSTRRSHRERLHGGGLKETIEEINEKERERGEKDDEDTYGEENDVYLTETSNISIRKTEVVEEEREEIKEELKASHTEDSTTENFIEVCPEQYMYSGLSSQTTELGLTTNKQPSPVTEYSDSKEDDGNSEENVEMRNADLQTQSQSKKKRKFGSTRRPQGGHRPDTEGEERRWKDVEATEGFDHDEKERCSEETHQAVTSNLLTESLNAVSEVSLGVLIEEMKEKESSKEQTVEESVPIAEESNSEVERLSFIPTIPTETCHQSMERQSEPSESITIIRPELEKLDKKKRKMGSTRKNFKGADGKKTWDKGTGDMDPKSIEDIIKEETKSTAREDTVLDDKGFGRSIIVEMIGQEDELQTHHMLDQSEGSLLGEIEYELKKSCQSPLNTTAHSISEEILESSLNKPLETDDNQQNILGIPEPKAEQGKSTLELPPSQSSQTSTEPSSPGRRRKMGSTRKTPRNRQTEEPRDESRDTEQDTENLALGTNSELEGETATLKITEDVKGSVGITAKVQAVSQVDENNTEHPIPEGRRKFGSRRTAKGEFKLNQKETEDVQVFTDELTVDPNFIPGQESTPVSQPISAHEDTKASPSNEQNEKSVVNEADISTRTGLDSLDDLRRSSLYNGRTGTREMIDFERWDEQIPDFGVAVYNVVMVGNCGVGKTSFIRRFQSGLFSKDYGSTIGVDTFVQTITLGNRTVKLHIWDTAGQERYHSITRQVFHKAQGLLLMYDITSSQSFCAVRNWISQIQERAPADVTMMLLGNKNDSAEREVQLKEGEDLSREYNIHFMECSAATGENVSESMKSLAWLLVKQNVRREEEQAILQPKQPQKKSGCC
ncbi:titin homolog [Colossoma macropomum]|uniref:titin homolog n=1 Tax=Colossoma macropomum TaxID=42526 RepID=UPI0018651F98|nr:titin homolog [Colossoma macropomum]